MHTGLVPTRARRPRAAFTRPHGGGTCMYTRGTTRVRASRIPLTSTPLPGLKAGGRRKPAPRWVVPRGPRFATMRPPLPPRHAPGKPPTRPRLEPALGRSGGGAPCPLLRRRAIGVDGRRVEKNKAALGATGGPSANRPPVCAQHSPSGGTGREMRRDEEWGITYESLRFAFPDFYLLTPPAGLGTHLELLGLKLPCIS